MVSTRDGAQVLSRPPGLDAPPRMGGRDDVVATSARASSHRGPERSSLSSRETSRVALVRRTVGASAGPPPGFSRPLANPLRHIGPMTTPDVALRAESWSDATPGADRDTFCRQPLQERPGVSTVSPRCDRSVQPAMRWDSPCDPVAMPHRPVFFT